MSIDVVASSVLMRKSIKAAKALLEDVATNNYNWSNERATLKRSSEKYDIDAVDMLTSKIEALA